MQPYHQPLVPNHTYHLFSRAVGSDKLFLSGDNYGYFLRKLKEHTGPVCDYFAYSLIPNHFHLLGRIKDEANITAYFQQIKKRDFNSNQHNISDFIMERFGNFLNCYTKAFNKMHNRRGALFMDYMRRSRVNFDKDFSAFVWYIHKNAVHHNLTKNIGEWPHDSYLSMLSHAPTSLQREELLDWFGGKEDFIKFHQQPITPKNDLVFLDL